MSDETYRGRPRPRHPAVEWRASLAHVIAAVQRIARKRPQATFVPFTRPTRFLRALVRHAFRTLRRRRGEARVLPT